MKAALRNVGLFAVGVLVAGCPSSKTTETLVVRGSNTFGEELAPKLFAEYKKEHPGVTFDAEFKATPYGIGALMAGRCDLAAASRPVTTNEQEMARQRNIEFTDYVIGSYSVAVIVNPANPVTNLTREQVRDIFAGVVHNWKEVGGPDAQIHLCVRDPISGTYLGFQEVAMEKKPYATGLKTFTSYADLVQAVAKDPGAIGYSSVELATKDGVKGVSIGGVAPTVASVNQGQYPYARVLRLYTDKATEAPAAREFAQFVQSSRGQQILDQMGYVPHP